MDNQFHSTQREKPRVQDYQLESLIGEGGMGKVYKAIHLKTQQVVAIKVLSSQNQIDMNSIRRFLKEVHVISQLHHRNIIRLISSGQQNGIPYFVMDFIEGITLRQWLEKKNSLRRRLAMVVKVARAVDYAHENDVIHRDLKPDNIMIRENNEPCVMDFGLAKFSEDIDNLTQTGSILGTFYYMSPEQAEGRKHDIDYRTDIYALGAILYECITKTPPFTGPNASSIIKQICYDPVVAPSTKMPKVSKEIDKICLKALAKSPQDRYQNLEDFIEDIEAFQSGKKVKARIPQQRSMVPIIVAAILFVAVALVAFVFLKQRTSAVPKKEIVSVYHKLKSDISSGIAIDDHLEIYRNKWGEFSFFHQKMAELHFYYAFVNDAQYSERLAKMKMHIDSAIQQQQGDAYNTYLLYQYYWIKRDVPQKVFSELAAQQNKIARLLPLYDASQNPLDFIQKHVRKKWLQAIRFSQKTKMRSISHIVQPFLYYNYLPEDILFEDYSIWIRGKRVSKIREAVYVVGILNKKLHYLAVSSDRKLVEVYIDIDTLETIGYKDLGNTPRVRTAKVNWEQLNETIDVMTTGFLKSFCTKGYIFLFANSKKYSQKPPMVQASPHLEKLFRLKLDLNNVSNSLYLFYKKRKISAENEFVMAAGLADDKVVYLAMTPLGQIKDVHYDFRRHKKIRENLVVQLNKQNMQQSAAYLRYAFLGHIKDLGYISIIFNNK
ncbi:serine/threonine protein kinase [Candidatus Uabimicrobium amorphum]|uniref:non-specific serine/threonine protein kinase n=1 Tax=Uabimicrobium amorphum TaxID=2596890 RepID=A0A5S9INI3_UABAM|nr:serine/threonine-protein kinase [Candidatus Uabimicrobium amorphum]BBM84320.1 serine/threonine protein kinase [Candidatus Uabimicrobium amorphum]